jgi:hypothetical protein
LGFGTPLTIILSNPTKIAYIFEVLPYSKLISCTTWSLGFGAPLTIKKLLIPNRGLWAVPYIAPSFSFLLLYKLVLLNKGLYWLDEHCSFTRCCESNRNNTIYGRELLCNIHPERIVIVLNELGLLYVNLVRGIYELIYHCPLIIIHNTKPCYILRNLFKKKKELHAMPKLVARYDRCLLRQQP